MAYLFKESKWVFVITAGIALPLVFFAPAFAIDYFSRVDYYLSPPAKSAAIADFNMDGKADVATVNSWYRWGGSVTILIGNGDGTFHGFATYPTGDAAINRQAITTGDFNGDGKVDLATANYWDGTVSLLIGNGDGTFQAHMDSPTYGNPRSVTAADFNGDGRVDLATAHGSSVAVLIGNGDGSFQLPCHYYNSAGYYSGSFQSLTTGDFNKDGKIDLATGNGWNSMSVFIGNGDGTFQPNVDYPAGRAAAIITGDFNNDGNLDLATANEVPGSISILLGNGDGTFQNKGSFTSDEEDTSWSLAAGDFNDDGKPDIATANGGYYTGSISILFGNGDGTFEAKVKYPAQPLGYNGGCFINSGDFNNDGKPDLVNGNGSRISILLNTYKKDIIPPIVELFTDPSVLWPPDRKMVNVFIGGQATDDESGIASVIFTVTDEYGSIQPAINVFNSFIQLEAWRDGSDKDGRTYTISAIATDAAGNSTTATTVILVPHDQR